jgi:hypothetical protein
MIKLPKWFLWTGFSSARGMDTAYEQASAAAQKQLDETLAGPDNFHVAPDDTDMKNPDGEFEDPAPMVESAAERAMPGWDSRGDRFGDPEGQQGGTEGGRPATTSLPNEVHPLGDTKK